MEKSLLSEICQSSLLQDEDNRLSPVKKENIRKALLDKKVCGTYAPYLIKKYWVKNMSCNLSNKDCLLFIELVSELLRGSRDDNKHLMNLVGKTSSRCKKMLKISLNRVQQLEIRLNKMSSLYRQTLNFCNQMTGNDDMLRTSLSSFQSETSQIVVEVNNTLSGQSLNFDDVPDSDRLGDCVVSYSLQSIRMHE